MREKKINLGRCQLHFSTYRSDDFFIFDFFSRVCLFSLSLSLYLGDGERWGETFNGPFYNPSLPLLFAKKKSRRDPFKIPPLFLSLLNTGAERGASCTPFFTASLVQNCQGFFI